MTIEHVCNAFSELPKGVIFPPFNSFSRLFVTWLQFDSAYSVIKLFSFSSLKNKGVDIKEMQVKLYIF